MADVVVSTIDQLLRRDGGDGDDDGDGDGDASF